MINIFSDDSKYITSVKRAANDTRFFNIFKRDRDYRVVLEHVSEADGKKYLDIIKQDSPDMLARIDAFKINDRYGSPVTYNYPEIGLISPTTLRYIKVAADLRQLFGDLSGFTIAEIGVGYGGQLLIIDQIWNTSYRLFDLPPVLELTSRYLGFSKLRQTNLISEFSELDLVISNYSFSELNSDIQDEYIANVLLKAKRGYLTMNCIDGFSLNELRSRLPEFQVLPENPETGPNNYIIAWG